VVYETNCHCWLRWEFLNSLNPRNTISQISKKKQCIIFFSHFRKARFCPFVETFYARRCVSKYKHQGGILLRVFFLVRSRHCSRIWSVVISLKWESVEAIRRVRRFDSPLDLVRLRLTTGPGETGLRSGKASVRVIRGRAAAPTAPTVTSGGGGGAPWPPGGRSVAIAAAAADVAVAVPAPIDGSMPPPPASFGKSPIRSLLLHDRKGEQFGERAQAQNQINPSDRWT